MIEVRELLTFDIGRFDKLSWRTVVRNPQRAALLSGFFAILRRHLTVRRR
jgi:hypothetical protein